MNATNKPIYLGSYILRQAILPSKITDHVDLDSIIDKDLSTIIYETIFVNQNYRVNHETYFDLSTALIKQFKVKKPDGTELVVNANYSGVNNSVLYYDITGTENNQEGVWVFQPLLSFPNQNPVSTWTIMVESKPTL